MPTATFGNVAVDICPPPRDWVNVTVYPFTLRVSRNPHATGASAYQWEVSSSATRRSTWGNAADVETAVMQADAWCRHNALKIAAGWVR